MGTQHVGYGCETQTERHGHADGQRDEENDKQNCNHCLVLLFSGIVPAQRSADDVQQVADRQDDEGEELGEVDILHGDVGGGGVHRKGGKAVLRLGHHQNDQTHGKDDDLDDKVQHIQRLLIL